MSRRYGRGKSHGGGAGLQFDKLLKACSNSKKPSVTKTAGALGRFGIASFTSTRNSSFDRDSCGDEESRFSSLKRPRFDVERNLAELRGDSFRYGENLMTSSPTVQLDSPPAPVVIKPKRFFKSRNPDNDQNQNLGKISSGHESDPAHLPPFPMPITIPTPRKHEVKKPKPGKKPRRKESTSGSDAEMKELYNTTNVTPPDTQQSNKSSTSPSIKLRIFKDKKTAKFVSVSDTSLPPKLEPQVQKDENMASPPQPKRRGRKPKAEKQEAKVKSRPVKIMKPEPATPQRRSGRLTRNSTRLRSSDSTREMPTLTPVEGDSESLQNRSPPHGNGLNVEGEKNVQMVDSAEKLVQRLAEEDSEFRELTAMLSSMEGGSENCDQSPLPSSPTLPNYHEELPVQPSPINYSTTATSSPSESSVQKGQVLESPSTPEAAAPRDFRSILEDEWDENYEDETPKKSTSPSKVSRFEMPEFMAEKSPAYGRNQTGITPEPHEFQSNAVLQIPQPHLNSSYAVRNLLSEITGNDAESTTSATATVEDPTPEPQEFGQEPLPFLTPEKLFPTAESGGSAKKSSIFKSRMTTTASSSGQAPNPKKRLALYKHKFGQEVTDKQEFTQPPPAMRSPGGFEVDFTDASEPLSLRRGNRLDEDGNEIGEASKVYCSHETKKLFTVVRNVKAIHELQESGEVHEFDGDIWYILEDLKQSNPISSRCLSAITLATRCMEPAFRMHLRAHGTVAEFSKELRDAPNNIPVLSLAAATVLFVLSQDRLNMDLDTESFQLILALAKTEQNPDILDENPELSKHKQRIIDLVAEMQNRGHAKHIKIEKITASELALETLLFLTSKRAGEWVKRELRTLGGLDYIVTEVEKSLNCLDSSIGESVWSEEVSSEMLWKIDRCLKVLHQVTFNHEENQKYLLGCKNQTADLPSPKYSPDVFVRLFQFLSHHLSYQGKESENFVVLRESLFSVLRLLVNLTHDYRGVVLGSEVLSARDGFLQLTLHSIFTLSTAFADGKGFDLLMHALCLLLNIVEHSRTNRKLVLSMSVQLPGSNKEALEEASTLDALIQLFFRKERDAKNDEASTDDILTNSTDKKDSSQASDSQSSSQDSKDGESSSVQDIIDKLIETAGKHMENSMIAAHISLLIAYLIMDDPDSAAHVQKAMPNSKFLPLMVLLKKLFNFMSITTSSAGSTRGLKATSNALKFFEKCDPESAAELKKVIPD